MSAHLVPACMRSSVQLPCGLTKLGLACSGRWSRPTRLRRPASQYSGGLVAGSRGRGFNSRSGRYRVANTWTGYCGLSADR